MDSKHWAAQQERGSLVFMRLTLWLTRVFGRRVISPVLYSIVLYFFLTGKTARRSITEFYQNLATVTGNPALQPSKKKTYKQFLAFADSILDKFDVWHGRINISTVQIEDQTAIRQATRNKQARGQLLVGSHLGNLEICRALAEISQEVQMNVLVHTRHAEHFNKLLGEAGAQRMRLIQVSELDAATMLQLTERLERGEWLAIAGDRIPLNQGRMVEVDFLGKKAALPQGPWLLAGILKCPVSLVFCLKKQGRYHVIMEPFLEQLSWTRKTREQSITQAAQAFADRLAVHCEQAPDQWFNFYPFWKRHESVNQ